MPYAPAPHADAFGYCGVRVNRLMFGDSHRAFPPCAQVGALRRIASMALVCLGATFAMSPVSAATKGLYLQADATLSIGPSQVSIANRKLGGGDGNTVLGVANDGRFSYGLSLGYRFDHTAVRLRYLPLGTQPTLSVNGQTNVSRAGVTSHFLGVEGIYLFPITPNGLDLVLIGGGGVMRTSASCPGINNTGHRRSVSQHEPVISLGLGLRVPLSQHLSGQVELTRLTPFLSGLRARGLYNNGQTVVSAGVSYTF